jgi:hypothetical protein
MRKAGGALTGALFVVAGVACSSELPPPQTRSVIIYSGERILPTSERMGEVETWLRPVLENIELDPSFLIRTIEEDAARYPWDALDLVADTADIRVADAALDADTPYLIYAFLRLMQERGTLDEWMPEAAELSGFELEQAIVSRVSDVWLLGRSVFDTQPFGPMDEILYSKEFGFLEEFLLATQASRFPAAVEAHLARSPERTAAFREWLLRTFEREGPGFLQPSGEAEQSASAVGREPLVGAGGADVSAS